MTKHLALKLSAVALLAIPGTARADLVLSTLQLNSGQGFGAVATIFTLQVTGGNQTLGTQIEQGCYAFGDLKGAYSATDNNFAGATVNAGNHCVENAANQVASGSPKNALYSFGDLSITNVNQVGLLLNLNQISDAGITVNDMVLSFYTSAGDVIFTTVLPNGWCTNGTLCSGVDTFLSSVQGQGGNGYLFVLDAAQQAALAAAITGSGAAFSSILVGAGANLGCAGTQTANCKEANDGAESLQLANLETVVTIPEPSTALLMGTGLLAMVGLARWRRRQT
jgi:hypothetical protein